MRRLTVLAAGLLMSCETSSLVPLERALNRQEPGALDWRIPEDDSALPLLDRWEASAPVLSVVERALLQRDLWMCFDRLPDGEVRRRLAEMLLRLRLSPDEIRGLPDPYVASAAEYPSDYDPREPEQPFLPRGLDDPRGPWVLFDGKLMVATQHNHFFHLRSGFLVYFRHPQGREAGQDFIRHLKVHRTPDLPIGSTFVLLRRALLISTDVAPQPSPLTETVQIRHYWGPGAEQQADYKFELHRDDLRLHALGRREAKPSYATMFETSGIQGSPRTPALSTCMNCHGIGGGMSVQVLMNDLIFPRGLKPGESAPQLAMIAEFKQSEEGWKSLMEYWGH